MRRATALLALLLLALPALAASQAGNGTDATNRTAPGASGSPDENGRRAGLDATIGQDARDDHDWSLVPPADRDRALDRAEQARLFGRLSAANGNASGRFVAFHYDPTGDLTGFTAEEANETTLFDVHVANFTAARTLVRGAEFRQEASGARVDVHNNPTAQLDVRGVNLTVTFDIAPGLSATPTDYDPARVVRVNVSGDVHGHIILEGNGTLSVAGNVVTATVADGGVKFLLQPPGGFAALREVVEAAAHGRLGAIARVADADGLPLEDVDSNGVTVHADSTGNGSVAMSVGSDEPEGKLVALLVDNGTLPAARAEDVAVTLNGQPVARAASGSDATNATFGGDPSVFVAVSPNGTELLLGLPHFSTFALVFSTVAPAGSGTPPPGASSNGTAPARTPGFEAVALLAALAVAAVALKKR